VSWSSFLPANLGELPQEDRRQASFVLSDYSWERRAPARLGGGPCATICDNRSLPAANRRRRHDDHDGARLTQRISAQWDAWHPDCFRLPELERPGPGHGEVACLRDARRWTSGRRIYSAETTPACQVLECQDTHLFPQTRQRLKANTTPLNAPSGDDCPKFEETIALSSSVLRLRYSFPSLSSTARTARFSR